MTSATRSSAWVDRALEHAGALLCSEVDAEAPVLLDHARLRGDRADASDRGDSG